MLFCNSQANCKSNLGGYKTIRHQKTLQGVIMKEFLKHYQIGCWFYKSTDKDLNYDPIKAQKDAGFTYATTPEHWRYAPGNETEKRMDKYIARAKELNMPVLYQDSNLMPLNRYASATPEKAIERLKFIKERYGDAITGVFLVDEPWWKYQDEGKSLSKCKEYNEYVMKYTPEYWSFIALLSGPKARWDHDYNVLCDYVETVKPEVLLYNVYSQCMAEEHEKEQGVINFFYQLNLFSEIAKKYKIPLWASLFITSCWVFRSPDKLDFRWQLNMCAAHGVKGFVWYHFQQGEEVAGKNGSCPIDAFGEKSELFYPLAFENKAFKINIIDKLEGYELEEVYHYYQRYGNFKMWEFSHDDVIEEVKSQYNRTLIISRFKANDGSGRQKVMITNFNRTENGHFDIKFKGEYAKYNCGGYSGYLGPAAAKIINLFDGDEPRKTERFDVDKPDEDQRLN